MKLYFYKICYYLSLMFSLVSAFFMIFQFYTYKVDQTICFSTPMPVNRMDKIYVLNSNTIVTHNSISGVVQFFDFEGKFLNGIHLATTRNIESTLVSVDGETVYLWEYRTKKIYTYNNSQYVDAKIDVTITDKDRFYMLHPLGELKYICKLSFNGQLSLINKVTGETNSVTLDTKFNHYSYIESIVCVFLSGIIAVYIKKRHLGT